MGNVIGVSNYWGSYVAVYDVLEKTLEACKLNVIVSWHTMEGPVDPAPKAAMELAGVIEAYNGYLRYELFFQKIILELG